MSPTKLVMIFSTWGDSHQAARLLGLEEYFEDSEILAYVRKYYPPVLNRDFQSLGRMEHGSYWKRILVYFRSFLKVFLHIRKNRNYYVFGFDNLFILKLACFLKFCRPKIIYEIADIRDIFFRSRFLRKVDSKLLSATDLVVMTSPGFLRYYEKYSIVNFEYEVMENKVHLPYHHVDAPIQNSGEKITIGYFGLLRCVCSLKVLLRFCREENVKVKLRGIFTKETEYLKEEIEREINMTYLGPYSSPRDLKSIYSDIDVSWIVYPFSGKEDGNWRYAMTNRFYEAGFYHTPMVGLRGSQDGLKVEEADIGFCVDLVNIDNAVKELSTELQLDSLLRWRNNLSQIDPSLFRVTDDYGRLSKRIMEL